MKLFLKQMKLCFEILSSIFFLWPINVFYIYNTSLGSAISNLNSSVYLDYKHY